MTHLSLYPFMSGILFPSINVIDGFALSFFIDLFIANKLAFKIFNFSISLKEADPMLQIEFFLIYFSKIFLFSFESFFESLILLLSIFFLNINGYWDKFRVLVEDIVSAEFASKDLLNYFTFFESLEALVPSLLSSLEIDSKE